jgi:DNA-directed RNA polymerase specialized sigma24 family protein
LAKPDRYAPQKGSLMSYLATAAIRKAQNHERTERRAARTRSSFDLQPKPASFRPLLPGDQSPELWLKEHRALFLSSLNNPRDRCFAAAHLDRAPRELQARLLHVGHLSAGEQRVEINRVWKRIATAARRSSTSRK